MIKVKRPKRIIKTACTTRTKEGEISFLLARSSGRRTLTITINKKADVSVASPINMKEREINSFVHEKARWIIDKVKEAQKNKNILDQRKFENGHRFLFLGRKYKLGIVQQDIRRCRISFDTLDGWLVVVPKELSIRQRQIQIKEKMLKWYRTQAMEILGGRIFHYSRLIGVEPKKIAVRTQKRLWGCCDYNTQTIHINWLIVLSPIKVIDYVVIHELCHLTIPNHSKRFWRKVEKFMPDYKKYQRWLSENHLDMVLP